MKSNQLNSFYFEELPPVDKTNFDTLREDIVSTVEYKREDGSIVYIDCDYRLEQLKQEREKLQKMLDEIKENNPLNQKKAISVTPSNDYIRKDSVSKRKKRGFSLRKVACFAGLILGLASSIKASPHISSDSMNKVVVDVPNPDNLTSSDSFDEIDLSFKSDYVDIKDTTRSKMRLGDSIKLNETKLYYTSTGENPSVKTSDLPCDQYKIRYIAVLSSQQNILEVVKVNKFNRDMTWDEFKDQYSSLDVHFQINVDGMINSKRVYKEAGWTSAKKIKKDFLKEKVKTLVKKN